MLTIKKDIKKMKKKMKENKIKLCSGKAAGNAGSVDYEQDYLSNKEIDMEHKFKPF